jgi:hypothetical protein
MEPTEPENMGVKNLKTQEDEWAAKLQAEVRAEFPHLQDRQIDAIVAVRLKALLSSPVDVARTLKAVDLGEDTDLSINYKKSLFRK